MKLSRVRAIARKEVVQVLRDPLSLALAFLLPVLLLFIFGYAVTLDVGELGTVVYDMDRTALSRDFSRTFAASGYFTIVDFVEDDDEIDRALDSGSARVAVSIPADFSESLKTGKTAPVGVIVDGSDSGTASIALGYVSAAAGLFSRRLGPSISPPSVEPRVRVLYNPELRSRNFIVPGLIAVIMAVIAALLTSLTIAREWERGTMEGLISTPVKTPELLAGKLIPYFIIGFIDVVLSILVAVFLFGVPLRGSVLVLLFLSSIFLFGGLGLGILISTAARNQLVASQVAMVATFLPAFLLSGFMYSVANMPPFMQAITRLIPASYFVAILKGIFLKGSPARALALESALLFAWGVVVFAITNKAFKKKVV